MKQQHRYLENDEHAEGIIFFVCRQEENNEDI